MKIKEALQEAKKKLVKANIQDENIIAKALLEYTIKKDRTYIIANQEKKLNQEEIELYKQNIEKIIQGIPLQYITNNQEFMGLDFYVDENVLIPQPDTEILVEEVINIISKKNNNIEILDMCTGSGCIGISISKYLEQKDINTEITLADISKKALEIAEKNAKKNNINKFEIIETNLFEKISKQFDFIVSNPPYIETQIIEKLDKQVQNEPHIALDGGKDGLEFYRKIIEESKKYLKENGFLALEIGFKQKEDVIKIMKENNYKEIYSKKDFGGNDRIVVGKKHESD